MHSFQPQLTTFTCSATAFRDCLHLLQRCLSHVSSPSAQSHLLSCRMSSWAGCFLGFWWFPLYELHVYSFTGSEAEALSEYRIVTELFICFIMFHYKETLVSASPLGLPPPTSLPTACSCAPSCHHCSCASRHLLEWDVSEMYLRQHLAHSSVKDQSCMCSYMYVCCLTCCSYGISGMLLRTLCLLSFAA
jgi:hypothetical protein